MPPFGAESVACVCVKTASSCAQIGGGGGGFARRSPDHLLHCDPVRNKASVLVGLTHTAKPSHTPSHTGAPAERVKRGSTEGLNTQRCLKSNTSVGILQRSTHIAYSVT